MAIAYTLMARVLWGSKQIGETSQAQASLVRSKQKVVRMLICGKFLLMVENLSNSFLFNVLFIVVFFWIFHQLEIQSLSCVIYMIVR